MIGDVHTLRPDRAVRPAVHFLHVAQDAGLHPFAEDARTVVGMALVAHLRGHLLLPRELGELPRLPDRVRERLLDKDVLAEVQRRRCDRKVHVIGRRHRDRVDLVAHLVEHLPEIAEARHLRIGIERLGGAVVINIAKCDEIFVLRAVDRGAPLAADPAQGDVKLAVRRARAAGDVREGKGRGRGQRRILQEIATGNRGHFHG